MAEDGPWLVQLYVYDLSHGMAKQFSPAFLGHVIEGIWHTGIVVYGKEFFYGGGIQCASPGQTVAGRPMKFPDIGYTHIPEAVFLDFLQEISHRFTPATYSLLKHNCNNFSNEVALFLTGTAIPEYITGLPEFAFSTPMGQMLKPMFEQFENQMKSQVGSVPIVPWEQPKSEASSTVINNASADSVEQKGGSQSEKLNGEILSIRVADEVEVKEVRTEEFKDSNEPKSDNVLPFIKDPANLKSIALSPKPFLSLDGQKPPTVYLDSLAAKVVPAGICDKSSIDSLKSCVEYIQFGGPDTPLPGIGIQIVNNAIKSWPNAHLFAILGLLRLLVAKFPVAQFYLERNKLIVFKLLGRCFPDLSSSDETSKTCSTSVRLMAICTIANILSHDQLSCSIASESDIIEAALQCIDDKHKFMRVVGANVAFNLSLLLKKQSDSDFVIQLVSKIAHVLTGEQDAEVRSRLLHALGHLILYHPEAASILRVMEIPLDASADSKNSGIIADIQFILSQVDD